VPSDEDDDEPVPPCVHVYSNELDNRAGWPVVQELGLALAERLGIIDDEADGPQEFLN
jgi:hypothetical protein